MILCYVEAAFYEPIKPDGLVKSRFSEGFAKSSKFSARILCHCGVLIVRRSDNAMKRNAGVGLFATSSNLGSR
jgi:hypothetical protein